MKDPPETRLRLCQVASAPVAPYIIVHHHGEKPKRSVVGQDQKNVPSG
jgi:hypothetical protein